jgi:precorrin-3B methylase
VRLYVEPYGGLGGDFYTIFLNDFLTNFCNVLKRQKCTIMRPTVVAFYPPARRALWV